MALVAASLTAELTTVFSGSNDSGAIAADKIATAYDNYCKTAMAGIAVPIFTGMEKTVFANTLAASLSSPQGNANIVGMAFQNAAMSYWMVPPVNFSGGAAIGMVSAMAGVASIGPSITTALSAPNEAPVIAQLIATILDTATRTVLVAFTAPLPVPPPPAPLA